MTDNHEGIFGESETTLAAKDVAVAKFLAAWRLEPGPDIRRFLPPRDQPDYLDTLKELVLIDVEERVDLGQEKRGEDYFAEFPEIEAETGWASEILVAEYYSRRRRGDDVELAEYEQRFPQYVSLLRQSVTVGKDIPGSEDDSIELVPGQVIGDFEIISLLGSGSHACVYLVTQITLDRRLALKVSRVVGDEGRALAKLDHPYIVPVYGQEIIGRRKLLAMPYVPGKTLADWIARRRKIDIRAWRSSDLLEWLNSENVVGGPETGSEGELADGALDGTLRFAPAMCDIMLRLARALRHAHGQGVLHRDIKPANVLLDRSGHALLTDFNVAVRREARSGSDRSQVGGTLAYMAPEHLMALEPQLPGTAKDVDARSDVYSLGVVFYELLTGSKPWRVRATQNATAAETNQMAAERLTAAPHVPSDTPGVTPALSSVVRKCLAPKPEDRYQAADELIEDLERLQAGHSPVFARDPSLLERAGRWLRRRQIVVAACTAAVVLVAVLLFFSVASDVTRLNDVERLLDEAATEIDAGQYAAAANHLGRTAGVLSRPSTLFPDLTTRGRRGQLEQRLTELNRQLAGLELRRFDRHLDEARCGGLSPSSPKTDEANDLLADTLGIYRVLEHGDWETRPPFRGLSEPERRRVREDVTELLLLKMLAAGPEEDVSTSAQGNRKLLERFPLVHRRLPLVEKALRDGRLREMDLPTPSTGDEFEFYLTGVIAAGRGEYESAVECFLRSLDRRSPGDHSRFWTRFWLAYCQQQSARTDEAIAGYGVCIGLRPDFAWPYYNLGLIYARLNNLEAARRHLLKAVQLKPDLAQAHADLGTLCFRQGDYSHALQSCSKAIDLGLRTSRVFANRAAARAAMRDVDGAKADLQKALEIDPHNETARENLRRLK